MDTAKVQALLAAQNCEMNIFEARIEEVLAAQKTEKARTEALLVRYKNEKIQSDARIAALKAEVEELKAVVPTQKRPPSDKSCNKRKLES